MRPNSEVRLDARVPWLLRGCDCDCGAPFCESGFLLAQPMADRPWLVLAITEDRSDLPNMMEVAMVSLEGDAQFEEAAETLCELYGWPWHVLDEVLACASYARMMDISDALSDELRHWGHVGVRDFRRLTGHAPASCEAALLCVRRHRLNVGGERVTGGPLARP